MQQIIVIGHRFPHTLPCLISLRLWIGHRLLLLTQGVVIFPRVLHLRLHRLRRLSLLSLLKRVLVIVRRFFAPLLDQTSTSDPSDTAQSGRRNRSSPITPFLEQTPPLRPFTDETGHRISSLQKAHLNNTFSSNIYSSDDSTSLSPSER